MKKAKDARAPNIAITTIQGDESEAELTRNELLDRVNLDRLDEAHREELQTLARFLSKQAYSTTDMRILYEVTGY